MAVTKVPTGAALKLKLNTGTDGSGNPVFRTKSLSNVKPAAADADIYDVAVSLSGLQSHTLASISRVDSAELMEA
ncbi:MAG: DUF1659 domain-containing protein [Desulfotomaculaceae bacterium]|nr:DUF1659 domain-containing protein [Desulfotomaculaceae bacterium]